MSRNEIKHFQQIHLSSRSNLTTYITFKQKITISSRHFFQFQKILKYDWNYYEDDCKGNLKVDVFVASTIARFQQMDYDGIVANEVVFMAIVNIWGYVSYRKSEICLKWLWRWLPGHFWAKIVEWSSRVFIGYRKPMARRKPSYYLNIKFASKMMIITRIIVFSICDYNYCYYGCLETHDKTEAPLLSKHQMEDDGHQVCRRSTYLLSFHDFNILKSHSYLSTCALWFGIFSK